MLKTLRYAFAAVLVAAPGMLHAQQLEEKWTKDVYGNKVHVQNDNRELPKFRLIGAAFEAAVYKNGHANNAVMALVREPEYAQYEADGELGPFIAVAKAKHVDAIVYIVMPGFQGHTTHAVFFHKGRQLFYARAGGKDHVATPEEVADSLEPLPEKIPLSSAPGDGLRLKVVKLAIDNRVMIPAYHVMHVGKAEVPWVFGDKNRQMTPIPAKQ